MDQLLPLRDAATVVNRHRIRKLCRLWFLWVVRIPTRLIRAPRMISSWRPWLLEYRGLKTTALSLRLGTGGSERDVLPNWRARAPTSLTFDVSLNVGALIRNQHLSPPRTFIIGGQAGRDRCGSAGGQYRAAIMVRSCSRSRLRNFRLPSLTRWYMRQPWGCDHGGG